MSDVNDERLLADLYPDTPVATLPQGLRDILPRDKADLARARMVVEAGYPGIAPILPHLLSWLQDLNWPVADPLAEYLSTLGMAVVEPIRQILAGDDDIWKYGVLRAVVARAGDDVVRALKPDLERLAAGDDPEDAHVEAAELLARLG